MRDWLFMMIPIGLVVYFLVNPHQFEAIANWMSALTR